MSPYPSVPVTLVSLNMVPKHKSSDVGNLDMPVRSHKVFLIKEKVKVPDLITSIFISCHHKRGEYGTIGYFERESTFT